MPLDFEKPVMAIETKIDELVAMSQGTGIDFDAEIERLRLQAQQLRSKLYEQLTPAQRLQIARHPQRPNFTDFVKLLSPGCWFELHGDRAGHDDRALLGGLAELNGRPVMLMGQQKGHGMKENLTHNFGMANPEGYRKALRLLQHAEKFKLPVITFIDTPGAYPGIHGEQQGIGQAIALNIREMGRLTVPVLSVVTGEGSSGGALGIGVANKIVMLSNAVYTVISPEGCASILWRKAEFAAQAAEAMRITAPDLMQFGIADAIVHEPQGGAHYNPEKTAEDLKNTLLSLLAELDAMSPEARREQRYAKYRFIGAYESSPAPVPAIA
ncbi:MAG: acetyl-CoA carboxylase carboxyltransferase subunit alpha [Vampirovibrionales bacterium]|nr:acetyl-CoA carboxylase carboxyltransferase subunit alpha [Vampirovibrionales bacterium]